MDYSTTLEHAGYAIVPNAVPIEDTQRMLELVIGSETSCATHQRGQHHYAIRHLLDAVPESKRLAASAAIRSLVEPVLGLGAFPARGLLFDKTPDANWKVPWHQDLTIAVRRRIDVAGFAPWSVKDDVTHVQAPVGVLERMLTLRLHLDDCDAENGALRVLPGSHRRGRLGAPAIRELRSQIQPVVCAVRRGDVVLARPLLVHASSAAIRPSHRRVIHLEFAADRLPGGLEWFG